MCDMQTMEWRICSSPAGDIHYRNSWVYIWIYIGYICFWSFCFLHCVLDSPPTGGMCVAILMKWYKKILEYYMGYILFLVFICFYFIYIYKKLRFLFCYLSKLFKWYPYRAMAVAAIGTQLSRSSPTNGMIALELIIFPSSGSQQ